MKMCVRSHTTFFAAPCNTQLQKIFFFAPLFLALRQRQQQQCVERKFRLVSEDVRKKRARKTIAQKINKRFFLRLLFHIHKFLHSLHTEHTCFAVLLNFAFPRFARPMPRHLRPPHHTLMPWHFSPLPCRVRSLSLALTRLSLLAVFFLCCRNAAGARREKN
jgi:hypothetical protein